ncbi:PREDICTED: 2,3-bisphosphoglycerate-dependent phosphoglycerate mutase [Theobroma cacao]|uniref:2,3-bisphosphoglycerate-dependent phosphoglycerate mutase n=1 Tax=Theobroma cacao TaxID=3641 RepID=A0AB32W4D7_THECC|nr:PREDICTED: 2,3-bisphosphoglycerate-dependent phosphoglycerate mutase [Theobroma cacao]
MEIKMTAMLAMTQHCHRKLPIIMHRVSGQVSSEETKRQAIPVITARRMNERMYIIVDIFLFELTISSKTNKKFNQFESCEHLL